MKTMSVTLVILLVLDKENKKIGHGFLLYDMYRGMSAPTLMGFDGKPIPENAWYQLESVSNHHTLINDAVH